MKFGFLNVPRGEGPKYYQFILNEFFVVGLLLRFGERIWHRGATASMFLKLMKKIGKARFPSFCGELERETGIAAHPRKSHGGLGGRQPLISTE